MRFEEIEDGYFDNQIGLEWAKRDADQIHWFDAIKLKDGIWRLPTIDELNSIVDRSRYAPATELPGIENSSYWSSTDYVNNTSFAWFALLANGHVSYSHKETLCNVRLVKGK